MIDLIGILQYVEDCVTRGLKDRSQAKANIWLGV